MDQETFSESPKMDAQKLINDLGGALSLYLAFSFVTILEFLAVFCSLVKSIVFYSIHTNKFRS
jgi:hypothetical protein